MSTTSNTVHDEVRTYYGQTLNSSDDLKTNACCCTAEAPPKYVLDVMPHIADEIIARFYGCGSPIPPALEGATVIDLGCGTGRDTYVLSKLVGEHGCVIGIDMTAEQLDIASAHQQEQAKNFGHKQSNVTFATGYIEDLEALSIADESVDLVVSNCVINLSPFKDRVFSEIFRVLKPGGELYFSDVFADRRIPDALRDDPVLRGECLGGALYLGDFQTMMERHGFTSYVFTSTDAIHVGDFELETKLGFINFTSRTVRAIKANGLERTEENYGQYATYKGNMPETPRYFDFDTNLRFIKNKPQAISRNTSRMLQQSRYGRYFSFSNERAHRGFFNHASAQRALNVRQGLLDVDLPFLEDTCKAEHITSFDKRVGEATLLQASPAPSTMQVNITYTCNLACKHCYLECSPTRNQLMSRKTMESCLDAFAAGKFKTLDITGGAPELHPDFAWFLKEGAKLGKVIVRTNLTLLTEDAHAGLLDLFVSTKADLVGSLPFYRSDNTDSQRGHGVFERAIRAIQLLNKHGYGKNDDLKLDLVYNVSGPFLPPPQEILEDAYRRALSEQQNVLFDNLLAFNNYALGRFAADLLEAGMFEDYLHLLVDNFNALAVTRMMCHNQVNIDTDGRLYDCECNHVLGLPIQLHGRDATVTDITHDILPARTVRTHPVCYSCAAGFGSSCGGSLV